MKKFLGCAFAAFIISSCTKEINEVTPEINGITSSSQQINRTDNKSINESLDKAAQILAVSLKEQATRSFIKSEALKQFDGDYDILYKSAKIMDINGRSLENILSGNMSAKFSDAGVFENVISNVRNFQISVPVHCEAWDAAKYIPLVAIAEAGVDEKDHKQVKAYDSDGNIHMLDAKVDPTMPVIVVGISERVDENGVLIHAEQNSVDVAAKVSEQKIYMGSIMCPDLSDIEGWTSGSPELELRVCVAKLNNGSTTEYGAILPVKYFNDIPRNEIDGKWYDVDRYLFRWYYTWPSSSSFTYGSEMGFQWVENDGPDLEEKREQTIGGTINASNGFSYPVSVTTSFYIDYGDENLGLATVKFTDPTDWYVYEVWTHDLQFELDVP